MIAPVSSSHPPCSTSNVIFSFVILTTRTNIFSNIKVSPSFNYIYSHLFLFVLDYITFVFGSKSKPFPTCHSEFFFFYIDFLVIYISYNCHFFTEPVTIINKTQTRIQIMGPFIFRMITYYYFFCIW